MMKEMDEKKAYAAWKRKLKKISKQPVVPFDMAFLAVWGICPEEWQEVIDVMREFDREYGEWDDYFGSYKWKKLTAAAQYYGYKFQKRSSLENARATLYIYKAMRMVEE